VAAHKSIVAEMEKLMEHMVSGVTSVAQRAALAAIEGPRDCVRQMVEKHKVAMVPGSIFGENGEGFVRISFATSSENLEEALQRIEKGVAE